MAMMHETISSIAFDDLSRIFDERASSGLRTLVIDRRAPGNGRIIRPAIQRTGTQPVIDLTDSSRWHALIVPKQERAYEDYEGFARVFRTWCKQPLQAAALHAFPGFSNVTGAVRCNEIVKALYDGPVTTVTEAVGESVLRAWRAELGALGEGPRAVVDDPWFSHLFLSPTADELQLAQPHTLLDVRSPDVPRRSARKIVAVVLDRLHMCSIPDVSSGVTLFVLEGTDLRDVIDCLDKRDDLDERVIVRVIWINQVKDGSSSDETTRGDQQVNHPESQDDSMLYNTFSSLMDQRHRAAFTKGIMYGYTAFCVLEDATKLPDDIAVLHVAGMVLGTSSPLVELFEDS